MTDEETLIPIMERDIVDSVSLLEHDLQLYDELPKGTMNVEDLEKLVMDRLTVLSIVEEIVQARKYNSAKRYRKILTKKLRKAGYESFASLCEGRGCQGFDTKERYAARSNDHVSHFVLLLGMSQSSNTRDWIRKMEESLFEWRLSALDEKGLRAFRDYLKYPMVDESDKKRMKDWLKPLMKHPSLFDSTVFYRVPAIEMLRSEARRFVYFDDGVAYPEHSHLRAAIHYRYKSRLRSRIQRFIGAHNYMIDPRIRVVVELVQKKFVTMKSRPIWNLAVARVNKLDEIAETCYPPCMRKLHEGLRKTHHLRNDGRVQYTRFLKAIGVTAEEALQLYKTEFTKEIDEADFDKEYTYIFRHLYGLVGSKKAHDVSSCSIIASKKPGPNDYHGCPLVTNDIEDLDKLLTGWKVEPSSKYEIVGAVQKRNHGKACAGYFRAIHKRTVPYPITNPKDFYRHSTKLHDPRDLVQPDAVPTKPDDVQSDDCESSEHSASSEEGDDSDDDCKIIDEINGSTKLMAAGKWRERRELVEFYKNVCEREQPIKMDQAESAIIQLTKSGNRGRAVSRDYGGIKSGTSNVVDERSYVDYILEYYDGLESKMDRD